MTDATHPSSEQSNCAHVMVGRVCQKCGVVAVSASGTYEPLPMLTGRPEDDRLVAEHQQDPPADIERAALHQGPHYRPSQHAEPHATWDLYGSVMLHAAGRSLPLSIGEAQKLSRDLRICVEASLERSRS